MEETMKNIAKPVLYILIGSACVYATLWIGALIQPLTGFRSFGFLQDALLGLLTIGMWLVLLALVLTVVIAIVGVTYELGRWIMEKLL